MVNLSRAWLLVAAAWASSPARGEPAGHFLFRTYGPQHGLGNPVIGAIAQDREGLVWVGCDDGAYRFDGDRFHHFGVEDGLPANTVTRLAANKDGVWFGTWRGLAHWDRSGLRPLLEKAGLPATDVYALAASDRQVLVGFAGGLY